MTTITTYEYRSYDAQYSKFTNWSPLFAVPTTQADMDLRLQLLRQAIAAGAPNQLRVSNDDQTIEGFMP